MSIDSRNRWCTRKSILGLSLLLISLLALAGCSDPQKSAATEKPAAVHIEDGEECHVCGMAITGFPGPKGEVITEKRQQVHKFCSTRDMFSWVLQPENIKRDHTLYVHDMAQSEWDSPLDTALIDAREAFYVIGSERMGAMGPTLASFANSKAAEGFAAQFGGQVKAFADITMSDLNAASPAAMDHGSVEQGSMNQGSMER
ncbi:nitrous oxide reductase accessory protein NosL [Marinobacter psychrophilus]|jgi:copper chaperone NosL|uniref:nitrous oxide reductase accessory protein NosL n=1 Tax=Marinobacter psychrophilus TaxID=330734 RepID=UPI00069DE697|nr:nitrous oxide reductase accessory protein NosL [Marinobacter psychrophilus]